MLANPHSSGTASVRADENTGVNANGTAPVPAQTGAAGADLQQDLALEDAMRIVVDHSEEAALLGLELGLSHVDEKRYSTYSDSILKQTLSGLNVPPPISDEWWDAPPEGAFDGGVARVMGDDELFNLTKRSLSSTGQPWVTDETDRVNAVRLQVTRSYGFARYAGVMMTALEESTKVARFEGVAHELSEMAAVAFLAGWRMGQEHEEMSLAKRFGQGKGTTEELVELLSGKIHYGAVIDEELTSRGYWTQAQVDDARRIVRRADAPDGADQDGTAKDGAR